MLEQGRQGRYLLKQALAHSAEEEGCTQACVTQAIDIGVLNSSYLMCPRSTTGKLSISTQSTHLFESNHMKIL
jgi:hypothetical protein